MNASRLPSLRTVVDSSSSSERRYVVSNVRVSVTAPAEILRILDVTMPHVPVHQDSCQVSLTVERTDDRWAIADEIGVMLRLASDTALPEVAGALTSTLVERVAQHSTAALVCGVIVAKNDFAGALVGDDWG